ncbi:MAG: hypothetical protein FJX68_19750 [Alphaproteobacteria bacterium]|nr:hypothetical protein [Alphaproteobacteria bacterium]
MRDLAFSLGLLTMCLLALWAPAAGVLAWMWVAMAFPQFQTFSFARGIPANAILSVFVLMGWLFLKERKHPPAFDRTTVLIYLFFL